MQCCTSWTDLFKCTSCRTQTEAALQTCYLIRSQHTNIGPTSPSADDTSPDAWQPLERQSVGHWYDLKVGIDLRVSCSQGLTRGVTVCTSAFLACHQCSSAGSSLAWGLNLRALVCGICWSSSPGVFSGYSGFLPSFIG